MQTFTAAKLITAAKQNQYSGIKQLLKLHGANVNAVDEFGWTATMKAAQLRKTSALECLIEHKANVNYATPKGRFALCLAALNDFEDTIEQLLLAGMHTFLFFTSVHTRPHIQYPTQERTEK